MILKKEIKNHIFSLFLLSLGGWLLHLKSHSILEENPANYIPFILGLINITIIPWFFNYKKTSIIAYLINGFGVIIGAIVMAQLNLSALPNPLTISSILFKTILPDILILLPKLFIGHLILLYYYPAGLGRMFTSFWWLKHFFYVTSIYILGHLVWR